MLSLDGYRIKVIHYHDPHLIWADNDNVLEQIGLYGIVPHGKTLAFNVETSSYCFSEIDVNKWLPAAMNLMNEFFEEAKETWFSHTYLDDGGIFDNGKHKFGQIYIKSKNGVVKNLSEFLTQSLFAIVDKDAFHKILSQKQHTKLSYTDIKDVIKKLNSYYKGVTNKFETYKNGLTKHMNDYKGDPLDEINWKFVTPESKTDNDITVNYWQKMDETPKNKRMLKKLETLKQLNKNIENKKIVQVVSNRDISVIQTVENDANAKIKNEKKTEKVERKERKPAVKHDYEHGTGYHNAEEERIDLMNITCSMCDFVDKIVTPVVMVHSKSGKGIAPMHTMRDIPFTEHIRIVLGKMSIRQPMALQSITWHAILRGRSVFIVGPKLSGKTVGYLPSVCRLVSDGAPETCARVGPLAVIVCATAESVAQVAASARMLLRLGDRLLAAYPGLDDTLVAASLLNGCDLLVATPTLLVRLWDRSEFTIDTSRLRIMVLDDCERLSVVYREQVKLLCRRVREVERSRANGQLRVQYVVVSRVWCDFMGPLALKAPDTVIALAAFDECLIYSKAKIVVSFAMEDKVASVLDFLVEIDASKKLVVVCRFDDEVETLADALRRRRSHVLACTNGATLSELHNIHSTWNDPDVALLGPILICTDGSLSHLNITDASSLLHYTLPDSYSLFRKRFFVLNENYPSIFRTGQAPVKVKILVDSVNTEKLPKVVNFIRRCTEDIPPVLDEICERAAVAKDLRKAAEFVPICGNLLTLGYCPEDHECQNRHRVLKGVDDPPEWMPMTGHVTFEIIHLHTAAYYSARLLSHTENNKTTKYPPNYALAMKMGMHFGNAANRRQHGTPKVGDVCAVSLKQDTFARCRIVRVIGESRGSCRVLIQLLDEEKLEETRDIFLFHLPESLASIETYTVQVRLANVQPKDDDVTFSELALNDIRELVDDEDSHVRARVVGAVGNCMFVDTLEICENLTTLDQVIVKYDLREELLRMHAEQRPDYLVRINELCGNLATSAVEVKKPKANTGVGISWAYLDIGAMERVLPTSVIDPDRCLLRVSKFDACMQLLSADIQTHVAKKPQPLTGVTVGDIILAKYPDNDLYARARVDEIGTNLYCYFVDRGHYASVLFKDATAIPDELVSQLPFQSIECRLAGVQPLGNVWTEPSIAWLSDYVKSKSPTTHFTAKAVSKQPALHNGGNKYSIVLIDTSSSIVVNRLMIDLKLACELEDEIHHLDEGGRGSDSPEEWEQVEGVSEGFMPQPIRSVPLIGSDSESNESDTWDVYNMTDFIPHLKQLNKTNEIERTPPAIMPIPVDDKVDATVKEDGVMCDEIRSSDGSILSKTEETVSEDAKSTTNPKCPKIEEARHPKLLWRQDKCCVIIKIQLMGVGTYDLTVGERHVVFSTQLNDAKYAFDFELYGVVDKDQSTHTNKGQYIFVRLVKLLQRNWGTLGKFARIQRWIQYDVDSLDVSSEDDVLDDSILRIVRDIHEKGSTDSEDDS